MNGTLPKVVVFGGSGFLGGYVCEVLSSKGYEILIFDVKKSSVEIENASVMLGDILKPDEVLKAVKGAVYVFNFAGLADLDKAKDAPIETMQLNVMGNLNILEACRKEKPKRYIFASSAYALSNRGSFYGISKFASEKIVEEYGKKYGLSFSIIRYGSIYGERADSSNGVYRLLKQAIDTGGIKYKGTGEEIREYIHAHDAAVLSVMAAEKHEFEGEHLILTGTEKLSQKELFFMINEIMGDKLKIEFTNEYRQGHYRSTPYAFSPNMAKKLTANPFIDLGQGLVNCLKAVYEETTGDHQE